MLNYQDVDFLKAIKVKATDSQLRMIIEFFEQELERRSMKVYGLDDQQRKCFL